jgi:hypothetical protein
MRYRVGLFAASLCFAAGLQAQSQSASAPPQIWQIDLVPAGQTFAATEPVLANGVYTFQSWPEHAPTHLKQERVRRVSPKVTHEVSATKVYQIDLNPRGQVISRTEPVARNGSWIYRSYRDGTMLSVRQSDVKKITPLSGEAAYWATERVKGEVPIGPLAMEGGSAIAIASPVEGSSQAGAGNASGLHGISGAPVGNWVYQGTPGTADAYGPANATVSSPGGVPQMPAATNGTSPPR